jgi:predicted AAA+ superfamily ATPase
MDTLKEKHKKKIANTSTKFVRSIMNNIQWNARLIGIKGARGVGKTTLLLQYIKIHYAGDPSVLYVSMDDIYFSGNNLISFADQFAKEGGKCLFLDEVHKYPNWSQEIKNIYDDLPELQVVFTGSSLLEIINARADLSRRAISYKMQGLSFREYLNLVLELNLPLYDLNDILSEAAGLSATILKEVKPLKYFSNYLSKGYYPFFQENEELYHLRIEEIINMIIELELPLLRAVEMAYTPRLKQLLLIIAQSAPFIPNISKLSKRIGINRTTLLTYLTYLQEAGITRNLYRQSKGISKLQKPEKIFLENSNFAYTHAGANTGNVRETFFANQIGYHHQLSFPKQGDFLVDDTYLFEIGGRRKGNKQIVEMENSYIAADNLEYAHDNKIPLWLFGFLY